jgi:beta-galactosidase
VPAARLVTRTVTVDGSGLALSTPDGGTEVVPMWSAEMHYWRLDPAYWPRILDAVADLGFTAVSSYSPWSRHERPDGSLDFTGALDVERFWRLAAERGLYILARPGPNGGAELEDSGWSCRVLDDPACQARRPDGRPYLLPTATHHAFMPSFGSRTTLARVGEWYDVIAPLVAAYQWPDGPIVASQVDNEMGYHFQSHPFALDFHPDTLAQWHEWRGAVVDPPRDGRDGTLEERVAWIAFREHHLRRSLTTLGGMLRERGVDRIPLTHNDYPRTTTPFDSGALERDGVVDVATGDVYATRQGGRFVCDYARHLSGTSKLPWLAEAGVGWITLPWLLPMASDPRDAEHNLWRALSGGVRAFNVFMAVERDRWYGAPISVTGELREPQASAYRRVLGQLREVKWHTLRRRPPVLLVENRDESRLAAATAVCGDLVPPFTQVLPLDPRLFNPGTERSTAIADWERNVREQLNGAQVDYDVAASSSLPDLSAYETVAVPSRGTLSIDAQERLAKAEADGVQVVTDDVDDAAPLARLARWTVSPASVDVTEHVGDDGERLLVVVNGGDDIVTALVSGPDVDLTVELAPWAVEVRMVPA